MTRLLMFLVAICVALSCISTAQAQTTTPPTAISFCTGKGTVGLYANTTDTLCKGYIKCFLYNGLQGVNLNCTGSTLFNPTLGYCDPAYTCTSTTSTTTTTTTSTSTTTTTTTTATTAASICAEKATIGLFADTSDTTCKQYAKCYEDASGLQGDFYTCSGSTLFDPVLQDCDSMYVCTAATTA